MKLWIVGKWHGENANWEFMGVFSTQEKAVTACLDRTYFLGSAILDEALPRELIDWKDFRYPSSTADNEMYIIPRGC
jgi:hypothetical protein